LGTSLPASTQGKVLTDLLALPSGQQEIIAQATAVQQSRLINAYRSSVAPDQTNLTSIDSIRNFRLNGERLPRIIIATLLFFSLFAFLLWKRERTWIALLNGALIYIAVFNFRFILIDEPAYSLSSLGDVSEAMTYFGITCTIAMLIAGAVIFFGQKLISKEPGEVCKSLMDFSLLTIFFLFIPVLASYALNGWKATWTLPEFNTVTFAFFNTIQILFVSLLGIVLASLLSLVIFFRT
jgi:hypothetical protein